MANEARLNRAARKLDELAPELPWLVVTFGLPDDGLFHGQNRTYTEAEKDELAKTHNVIILSYGEWPPDEPYKQMTWGDEDND